MYIFKSHPVKQKLQKLCEILFSVFLKCAGNDNFKELTILIPRAFLTGGVPTKKFSIRIQFVPFDKQSCAFSSSNLLYQKLFFTWSYKFFQILIHTQKTRETIINIWYFIDVQFYFTDNKGYIKYYHLYSLLFRQLQQCIQCKKREKFLCLCSVVYKKNDWILRKFSLINKKSLYL